MPQNKAKCEPEPHPGNTAHRQDTEEDNLEGLETGADAYMTKPFHMEILRKTAANLIRSRERLRNTYTGQQTQGDKVQPIEVQSPMTN